MTNESENPVTKVQEPEQQSKEATANEASAKDASAASSERKPIQIGSQRDAADTSLKPSQPKAVQQAKANPVPIAVTPEEVEEPLPNIESTEGFSDDVESEIEAAIGGVSVSYTHLTLPTICSV